MNFQNDLNPDTSEELSLEQMSEINAGLGPLILLAPFIVAAKVGAAKAAIGVADIRIGVIRNKNQRFIEENQIYKLELLLINLFT